MQLGTALWEGRGRGSSGSILVLTLFRIAADGDKKQSDF